MPNTVNPFRVSLSVLVDCMWGGSVCLCVWVLVFLLAACIYLSVCAFHRVASAHSTARLRAVHVPRMDGGLR
jgi:hypothetical protein